jgi:peptide/nickel transport system ATP-binding protein
VQFPTEDGLVNAVSNLSFEVDRGETIGIVGESGSGKSVAVQAIMALLGRRTRVSGSILLDGFELVHADADAIRERRGRNMAMIFQDPLAAMHPFYTVGKQIAEAYRVHNKVTKKQARAHVVEMLHRVGIADARRRFEEYPHEFSGGMRQRAMIAMALICGPALLIADEPTTALDVIVQAQILELIRDVQQEFNSATILITHDLAVAAESCTKITVMYGGSCVESGTVEEIFNRPEMPYTWGLLGSIPRFDDKRQSRLAQIAGSPPSSIRLPRGCVFHPRCGFRDRIDGDACTTHVPELLPSPAGGFVRCHLKPQIRKEIWSTELSARQ